MTLRIRRRLKHRETPELNITAFLNLMVVLIPFLLLSAAFSHITTLDLYLPTESEAPADPDPKENKLPKLEVILRGDRLQLLDRNKNLMLAELPFASADELPLEPLHEQLKTLKKAFPSVTAITILAEPSSSYDQIIQVMDKVRSAVVEDENGQQKRIELFPDIGIGDAPKVSSNGGKS